MADLITRFRCRLSRTQVDLQRWLAWASILLLTCWSVALSVAQIRQNHLPVISQCWDGADLAYFQTDSEQARFFMGEDEGNYLLNAWQLARGEVAHDFNGSMISAAMSAPFNAGMKQVMPIYDVLFALGRGTQLPPPYFVSYRSVVFPALGAPVLQSMGCSSDSLLVLRYMVLPFKALLILSVCGIVLRILTRFKYWAALLTACLLSFDTQLTVASSTFMADVPGSALFFLALLLALSLHFSKEAIGQKTVALAILTGGFFALAVLIKFDFLYVAPLFFVLTAVLSRRPQRRLAWQISGVIFLTYAMCLGVYAHRNQTLTDQWFLTSKDTVNLYIGNNADAPNRQFRYGFSAEDMARLKEIPQQNSDVFVTSGPELAMRLYFRQLFIQMVSEHPVRTLEMVFQKATLFLTSGQYVHYPWFGRFSWALSTLVMVLGLFGFASLLFAGRLRNRQLLVLPVAYAMLLGMLSWVFFEPRFLTHLYPFAILSIFACLQVLQSRFDDDRSTTKRVIQSI